ncbi:MAG: hypothetical protein GEV00_03465 [Actinophytocola sp.]|nr:hypothetical protein [Actinophytocola sp.]
MSDTISDPGIHRPGRHRRGAGASTWTPTVASQRTGSRHRSAIDTADTAPLIAIRAAAAAAYGHAPRPRARARAATPTEPRPTKTATTTTMSGVLPLADLERDPEAWNAAYGAIIRDAERATSDPAPAPEPEPLPDDTPIGEDGPIVEPERPSDNVLRRTKVTLTPTELPRSEPWVYYAPPKDGLSTFDLGTVPASVTPPRSWKKAAWFATVSSGGVVVALLVAASYVVGQQPPTDQVASDNWTGLRGENPPLYNYGFDRTTQQAPAPSAAPSSSSQQNIIADRAAVLPSHTSVPTTMAPQPTPAPSAASPTMTTSPYASSPTTTQEPQKPPPSPAPRETRTDYFYRFPPDAETMGDRSEIFLNQITENPEKAHEQTGGELYAEGAESIAARYSDIAYFEIKHIYIDQRRRITINTVVAVYKDGTRERQQRTLQFEQGDKITDD